MAKTDYSELIKEFRHLQAYSNTDRANNCLTDYQVARLHVESDDSATDDENTQVEGKENQVHS